MRYIELQEKLKAFTIFSLNDIRSIEDNFFRTRLSEWQNKGYIKKVIKGYYIFCDTEINENILFEIANRIYRPSYISFEMALAYYGLIPESVYGLTSASTLKTYKFKTSIAQFSYRTLKSSLFFGYNLVEYTNKKYFKMASIEKALLDYFYINTDKQSKEDFASIRLNKDIFFQKINIEILNKFLEKFDQKRLTARITSLHRFMKNA